MKRLFKRKKKHSQESPSDLSSVTRNTKATSSPTNGHLNVSDIDEAGYYSVVRNVKVGRVSSARQRADRHSSGHEKGNSLVLETERLNAHTTDKRPRLDSPVEGRNAEARVARNTAPLVSDKSATEPPYAKVKKIKSKKIGKNLVFPSSPSGRPSDAQALSVGDDRLLSRDGGGPSRQLQQRSERGSLVTGLDDCGNHTVSGVKGDLIRSRETYSPAHVGKLEIVRQGNSFIVENDGDFDRQKPSKNAHYDILEQDYSISESSADVFHKETEEKVLGKAHSEGEISTLGRNSQVENRYNRFVSSQSVEHSLHEQQLAHYDHIHAADSEPLKTTFDRSSYQSASLSRPQTEFHTYSHSPNFHVSPRQRNSSPGEQTTASAPDSYSPVSPKVSLNNRSKQFDDTWDDGALQLLHLSNTSLISAKPKASEMDAVHSITTRQNQDQKSHELSAQLTAVRQVVAELQVENETLKELSSSVQEDSSTLAFLKREKSALDNDNRQLRDMVHRLAVELTRYQSRHAGPSVGTNVKSPSRETVGAAQVVFTAYDERLKEKDDLLSNYENHLKSLKQQIAGVSEENRRLTKRVKELTISQPITSDEWLKIQDEVKVVVEENSLLMEEREIQQRKMKAQLTAKEKEVTELSDQISSLEDDKKELQDEIKILTQKCDELKERCERLIVERLERMPIEEHLASIEECHRVTQDVERCCKAKSSNAFARLQAVQTEKQSLEVKKAEAAEHVARLQANVAASRRAQERCQREIASLRKKLVARKEREISLVALLQKAVEAAEKAQAERNAVGELAQEREKAVGAATTLLREDDTTIGRLEEKLKRQQALANKKLNQAAVKLKDRDKEHQSRQREYLEEIRHLQVLLRDKQRQLESMASEKRNIETQMSLVIKSVRSDNNAVRASLRRQQGSRQEGTNSDTDDTA